jgi:surface polysaccharide O-acyltransferase-like enzyme
LKRLNAQVFRFAQDDNLDVAARAEFPLSYTLPAGLPLRRYRHPEEDDTMIGAHSFVGINFWAVLVCAIASMAIGFLWYSPVLFANPWMRLMGIDPNDKAKIAEMQKGAGRLYGLSFVASIASALVLAKIIDITSVDTIAYGMKIGFAVWLGFVTTVQLTGALFGKQPTKLYLINTGYQLVCYLAMGAILAKWTH